MYKPLVYLLLCLLSISFVACDSNRVYDQYKSLHDANWQKDSLVSFRINDIDSTATYNAFINIRNNNDFKYRNLFLITKMNFPNGKVITDTLEYEMAFPDGSWMGSGYGGIKENKLWYKEGVRFPEKGEYTFSVQQAMRKQGEVEKIEKLEGITEVGFRIEKPIQEQ